MAVDVMTCFCRVISIFMSLCILLLTLSTHFVQATCSTPSVGENSYALESTETSYALNETYEIFCVPGYVTSDSTVLTCQSTGSWSSEPPSCSPAEGIYPWWMLLVGVLCVILLVACVLPRLVLCFRGKDDKKTPTEEDGIGNRADDNNFGYDDNDDYDRSNSPVPRYKKRMNNMDYMAKLYKDEDLGNVRRAKKNATF